MKKKLALSTIAISLAATIGSQAQAGKNDRQWTESVLNAACNESGATYTVTWSDLVGIDQYGAELECEIWTASGSPNVMVGKCEIDLDEAWTCSASACSASANMDDVVAACSTALTLSAGDYNAQCTAKVKKVTAKGGKNGPQNWEHDTDQCEDYSFTVSPT